jgi:hypothetical protein
LDLRSKKAEWQGLPLEIARVTEQHVDAYSPFRFDGNGLPAHDQMKFVFNRLSLEMYAYLSLADGTLVGEKSSGHCREVVRPL